MKKMILVLAFLALTAAYAFSASLSVITMKDGRVFKCEIIDLVDGVYTLEIKGRQYNIKEKDVEKIGWEDDGAPSKEAPKYRDQRDTDTREHGYYFYLRPALDYLLFCTPEEASVYRSGIMQYGIEAGIDTGGGGERNLLGLLFLAGSASGSLTYNDIITGSSKISPMSTTRYSLQMNFEKMFGPFKPAPLGFSLKLGLGGGVNTDTIALYPVLTENYYPYTGYSGKFNRTYFIASGCVAAGMDIYLNNNWIMKVSGGYQLMTADIYADSGWLAGSDFSDLFGIGPPIKASGAVILGAALHCRF